MKANANRDTHSRRVGVVAALAVAGAAACAAAVALTLSGNQSSNPALEAQIRAAIIGVPIAVGLYAWNRDPWRRFARLLVIAGFAWSLTTLAQSGSDVVYSAGRVFAWFVEPLLIFLVLAFPTGRLTARPERALVAGILALVALLYLPTMLLVDSYPTPSPWTSCGEDCPTNAFMVLGSEPGFVDAVIVPLREIATVLLFTGVVLVLAARIRKGTRLMRITLVPVLAVAIVHALAMIGGIVARRAFPGEPTEILAWAIALSFAGVAVGFMVGLGAWRVFENRALRRLAAGLAAHRPVLSLSETSELLSESMDRSLVILQRPREAPDGWVDMEGNPSRLAVGGTRCVTEISSDPGRVVGVVHDPALRDDPIFLDVARASVLKALELERLSTELRSSLRELSESRARIMSGADRERQRIERDLHDGAQQSLVAVRIRLELAGALLRESPASAEQLLGNLSRDVDDALEQVRSLARGVYPSLLSDRGLGEALRSAARRSPVRITVDADGVGRQSPMVEAAVYFCCLEAIQNAMKHAVGVKTISVSLLVNGGELHFQVRDDGSGFERDQVTSSAGLTNMSDRLAAVGGVVVIRSTLGRGTRVSGTVPLGHNGNGSRAAIDDLADPVAPLS